jgi:hypothetical protein
MLATIVTLLAEVGPTGNAAEDVPLAVAAAAALANIGVAALAPSREANIAAHRLDRAFGTAEEPSVARASPGVEPDGAATGPGGGGKLTYLDRADSITQESVRQSLIERIKAARIGRAYQLLSGILVIGGAADVLSHSTSTGGAIAGVAVSATGLLGSAMPWLIQRPMREAREHEEKHTEALRYEAAQVREDELAKEVISEIEDPGIRDAARMEFLKQLSARRRLGRELRPAGTHSVPSTSDPSSTQMSEASEAGGGKARDLLSGKESKGAGIHRESP